MLCKAIRHHIHPSKTYKPLKIYRRILRYRTAKMKATEIAKEMAVARGFFHYVLLALLFEG